MSNQPDPQRTKDLLINWRLWARDCPPDPAEVYYYTKCPVIGENITVKEAREMGLTIPYMGETQDLFRRLPPEPVTLMTPEEYADAVRQ